jgi:hypothetical protein
MLDLIHMHVIPATYSLLPQEMASQRASAMLLSIGLQESGFANRRQVGGPARGFWQFEVSGVRGVLEHPATKTVACEVLKDLEYDPLMEAGWVQALLEHNDILACAFARMLLWTSALALADVDEAAEAWTFYLSCWRPGKPSGPTPLIA